MRGGDAAAAGNAGAVHRRHGQRRLTQDGGEEVAQAVRIAQVLLASGFPQRLEVRQVGAGGEMAPGAAEDHRADPVAPQVAAVEVGETLDQRRRQGIGAVGIVERRQQQIVPALDPEQLTRLVAGGVGHGQTA